MITIEDSGEIYCQSDSYWGYCQYKHELCNHCPLKKVFERFNKI